VIRTVIPRAFQPAMVRKWFMALIRCAIMQRISAMQWKQLRDPRVRRLNAIFPLHTDPLISQSSRTRTSNFRCQRFFLPWQRQQSSVQSAAPDTVYAGLIN